MIVDREDDIAQIDIAERAWSSPAQSRTIRGAPERDFTMLRICRGDIASMSVSPFFFVGNGPSAAFSDGDPGGIPGTVHQCVGESLAREYQR